MKCEKVFMWAAARARLYFLWCLGGKADPGPGDEGTGAGDPMKAFLKRGVRVFCAVWRDERGQAMTEYVILMLMVSTLAFWLFHPENGFPKALRDRYELTTTLLMMPGP